MWIAVIAVLLTAILFFVVRVFAVRVVRKLAEETEGRIAARLEGGRRRTGTPSQRRVSDATRAQYLAQIDRIAKVMDGLVPLPIIGGIGLDAVVGLVPVLGDAVGLSASAVLIVRAAQLGAPPELLGRLVAMQCMDLVFGAVPVLGDLVDVGYRANQRSADLVHEWFNSTRLVSRKP